MDIYADVTFYTDTYLSGKEAVINTASFPFYARRATQAIKRYTGSNVDENSIAECVKLCCCEIAETLYTSEKAVNQSSGKTSERVGEWSVGYESSEQSEISASEGVKKSVYNWLSGTGLLYAGVRK